MATVLGVGRPGALPCHWRSALRGVCRSAALSCRWRSIVREGAAPHELIAETGCGDEAELLLLMGQPQGATAESSPYRKSLFRRPNQTRSVLLRRPDVVLVDLGSFHDEGAEVCRRLALAGRVTGGPVPVIAVASELDDEELEALLEAGAAGYILRELGASELSAALDEIVELTSPARPPNGNGHGETARRRQAAW